ncbi:MAG: DMT family transporter [candidate division WOR-3 bacterium]|nr:MAG: DMT family transporter [candidate division WOR-3 bacterium]
MQNQRKAYTYAAFVVLTWSTVASAFKLSLRYLDHTQLLFFATTISTITLFAMLMIQKKINVLRTCTLRDCFNSLLLGFLNPFLYYLVLLKAYTLLPAQQAVALNYTWAIQLVLLSIPLLRQRIGTKSILAIIVSYLGVLIIAVRGNFAGFQVFNLTGVLLALGSATIWALFWIYNIKDRRDEVAKLFMNFVFGFVFTLTYMIFTGRLALPTLSGLLGAAYVGVFEMGITFVLWLKALRLSRTTAQVSNLIYLTPFFALVFINVFVGESILVSTVVGLVFIVGGILLQKYPLWKQPAGT